MSANPVSTPILAIGAGSALAVTIAALFGAGEVTIIVLISISLIVIGTLIYLDKRARR